MADEQRKYDAEILALANLTLKPHLVKEAEPAAETSPEPGEAVAPLQIKVPHKKDVVLRLIKRIKKD